MQPPMKVKGTFPNRHRNKNVISDNDSEHLARKDVPRRKVENYSPLNKRIRLTNVQRRGKIPASRTIVNKTLHSYEDQEVR